MGITYDCYFIKILHGIDINLFISHTKRVDFCIIFIKFIDKFLILARNKHRRGYFSKNSCQYFPNNKKTDKCDQNNQRSVAHLPLESPGRCPDAHVDRTLSRPCRHLTQPRRRFRQPGTGRLTQPQRSGGTLRTVRSTAQRFRMARGLPAHQPRQTGGVISRTQYLVNALLVLPAIPSRGVRIF